jgi:ABC-type branched-subunit amino acid transport system ATPase component
MGTVSRIADRVIVLERGRIIADSSPESVLQNPDVIAAYFGGTGE